MLKAVEDQSRRYTNCAGYFQNEWGSQLIALIADFCFQQLLKAESGVLKESSCFASINLMLFGLLIQSFPHLTSHLEKKGPPNPSAG